MGSTFKQIRHYEVFVSGYLLVVVVAMKQVQVGTCLTYLRLISFAPPHYRTRVIAFPSAPRTTIHNARIPFIQPSCAEMEITHDVIHAVHYLKVDRDTWKAVALQYRAAFKEQTARLRDLQDICFATQAELENERAQSRRLYLGLDGVPCDGNQPSNQSEESTTDEHPFGSAVVYPPSRIDLTWKLEPSGGCFNPIFKRVEQLVLQQDYSTAMVETERLLRGPLSPKARAEGLLMKSSILQATGPDSLYEALASCSEALELCKRISELKGLLPKIQYQRGVFYYQLHMLQQARDAFGAASEDNILFEKANAHRQSCEDEIELLSFSNRRSAFDERRSATDSILANMDVGSSRVGIVYPYETRLLTTYQGKSQAHERTAPPSRSADCKANATTPSLGVVYVRSIFED